MSFCYVVLCHTDAQAALALASRIRELSPTATVVLRHDREDFITAGDAAAVGATLFRSALEVRWGGWSMVAATLEVLAHVRSTVAPEHVVLLSGHDYPVRNLSTWEGEVRKSGADVLLRFATSPTDDDVRHVMRAPAPVPRWVPAAVDRTAAFVAARVERFVHPAVVAHRHPSGSWFLGVRRVSMLWRPLPVRVRKASQWMTLSAAALDSALERSARDVRALRFFRTVRVPDELYFASVLADDPRLNVLDRPQTWLRFAPGAASPDWVEVDDVETAARSGAPFIRKVPLTADDVRRAADDATHVSDLSWPPRASS